MAEDRPVVLRSDFFERLARPETAQNPHVLVDALRYVPPPRLRSGELVLARHRDVTDVLRDPRFVKPTLPSLPLRSVQTLFRMFLVLNEPDHGRLRHVVAPWFTPASVGRRRDRVAEVAESLLGPRTEVEVIQEFAYPLPLRLISQWLGVRQGDEARIARWATTLTQALDAPMPLTLSAVPRLLRAVVTRQARPVATLGAARAIVDYARAVVAGGSASEEAEMLLTLRSAWSEGAMSLDEAVATWVLIVIAGHETTANLIGNATYLLLNHRDQLQLINHDPSLVPAAIEETLRYESPVPLSARVATADIDLAATTVAKGTTVFVLLGAANRDPDAFSSPNQFDIRRDASGNVAFGLGSHFCVGAHLARLEAEVAIRAILRRGPQLFGAPPTWRNTFATRGLATLRARFDTPTSP